MENQVEIEQEVNQEVQVVTVQQQQQSQQLQAEQQNQQNPIQEKEAQEPEDEIQKELQQIEQENESVSKMNNNGQLETKLFSRSQWIFQIKKKQQNQPCKRWGHSAVMYQKSMYVYGGYGDSKNIKSWETIYRFDCQHREWEKITPQGIRPDVRDSHAACQGDKYMYIFGGNEPANSENNKLYNDFWQFDFTKHTWKQLEQKGEVPNPREGHSLIYLSDRYILLIGGLNSKSDQIYNNILLYDLETSYWKEINKKSSEKLSQRESNSVTLINDKLYLFGGQGQTQQDNKEVFYNELYKIRVDQLKQGKNTQNVVIKKVEPTTSLVPSPRSSHSACSLQDRYLIIMGGEGDPPEDKKQEIEKMELERMKRQEERMLQRQKQQNEGGVANDENDENEDDEEENQFLFPKNDIFIFDTELNFWIEIQPSFTKGINLFIPRFTHTSNVYKNQVIVFGGMQTTQEKLDDLIILELKDESDEENSQNNLSQNNNQNQKKGALEQKQLCPACNQVYGISDWLQYKAMNKEQQALEAQKNLQEQYGDIQADPDPVKRQLLQLKYQRDDLKLKKELEILHQYQMETPQIGVQFLSQICDLIQYPFQAFGLIIDCGKLIDTKILTINLLETKKEKSKEDLAFSGRQCFGTPLKTEITQDIKNNSYLYFQIYFQTKGVTPQQFSSILFKFNSLQTVDEDDLNYQESNNMLNFGTQLKMGAFRLGETLLLISKNTEINILCVGYVSANRNRSVDVQDMNCFMFVYNYVERKFLSESGQQQKDIIVRNIEGFMSEEQLLHQHEGGNYTYILDLKRIPCRNRSYDYEFQYDPKNQNLILKKQGINKISQEKKKYIENLADYSLHAYIQNLYLDTKINDDYHVSINGNKIEMKNYSKTLKKLEEEGILQQAENNFLMKELLGDSGEYVLYEKKNYLEIQTQFQEKQRQKQHQEVKQEKIEEEQEEKNDQKQNQNGNNQNGSSENQQKIVEENGEEIIEVIEEEIDIQAGDNEQNKNIKQEECQIQSLIQEQQGVLVYYDNRLIGRLESENMGGYFLQKILRRQLKPENKENPYYTPLRYSGYIKLQKFLQPNLFFNKIDKVYFQEHLQNNFKTFIRQTKIRDRNKIADQIVERAYKNKLEQNQQKANECEKQHAHKVEDLQKINEQLAKELEAYKEQVQKLKQSQDLQTQKQQQEQQKELNVIDSEVPLQQKQQSSQSQQSQQQQQPELQQQQDNQENNQSEVNTQEQQNLENEKEKEKEKNDSTENGQIQIEKNEKSNENSQQVGEQKDTQNDSNADNQQQNLSQSQQKENQNSSDLNQSDEINKKRKLIELEGEDGKQKELGEEQDYEKTQNNQQQQNQEKSQDQKEILKEGGNDTDLEKIEKKVKTD